MSSKTARKQETKTSDEEEPRSQEGNENAPATDEAQTTAADKTQDGDGRIRASGWLKAARLFRAKHGDKTDDEGPTDEEDARPSFRSPGDVEIHQAPQSADQETRALLKALKRQQELRLKADIAEAKELERRAKEISKQVKDQQRLRKDISKHYEYVQSIAQELGFDPERPVTTVPGLTDPALSEVERITIQDGIAYVRVLHNAGHSRHEYEVIEPQLTKTEEEVLRFIRDTLVRTMEGRGGNTKDEWEEQLLTAIERVVMDHSILIDDVARQKIQYYLIRDFLGYGPIDVLMRDPMVEDISCDGPGLPVFLFHRQYESIRTNVVFADELALDSFVIRLGQRSGKHISIADPLLDATLPDKSRLQATLAREVTTHGSSFTIRRFRSDPLTPADLVRLQTWSPAMASYFWFAMQEGNSILYAGGTASGKTTALNAMGIFIPPEKKIVSIEDTREISLPHENWIAGVTRSGFGSENAAGKRSGEVDMFKLLEAALRQRPEYLLVGEVRGREAQTLFQAMATGHATYSTVHADSAASAVYRLENEPIKVPRMMIQTADIIAVQVQARVGERLVRRLKEVVEIVGMDPETGDLLTNKVFAWDPATDQYHYFGNSHVLDLIRQKRALRADEVEAEWNHRTRVIRWAVETGIRNIHDFSQIVSSYYSGPERIMEQVREWERRQLEHDPGARIHATDVVISEAAAHQPAFGHAAPREASHDDPAAAGPQVLHPQPPRAHEDPEQAVADGGRPAAAELETRWFGHPNDPQAADVELAPIHPQRPAPARPLAPTRPRIVAVPHRAPPRKKAVRADDETELDIEPDEEA